MRKLVRRLSSRHAVADDHLLRVGIEVHAQLRSSAKLFSGASASFTDATPPNARVGAFDMALPGTLPGAVNRRCVELAVHGALSLGCDVQPVSRWDRKHYSYGDLPLGFQVTQKDAPLALGGSVRLASKTVRLSRVQLEQDSGRSVLAPPSPTRVDLSRAGTGLVEVVSEPDIATPEEAGEFVRAVQRILCHAGACEGSMERGQLRADVNISVSVGARCSPRVEVKNLNSVRGVVQCVEAEERRLVRELASGERKRARGAETRWFHPGTGETGLLRRKEDGTDYRFLREPDLPALVLTHAYLEHLRGTVPEGPAAASRRLLEAGVRAGDVEVLLGEPGGVGFLDAMLAAPAPVPPRRAATFLCNEVLGALRAEGGNAPGLASRCGVAPEDAAEVLDLLVRGRVSAFTAKALLARLVARDARGASPAELIRQEGLGLLDDREELRGVVAAVLRDEAVRRDVRRYAEGTAKVRANPRIAPHDTTCCFFALPRSLSLLPHSL